MTILVRRRVYRTTDGRLVLEGDLDAAFLAYPVGTQVPDLVAARDGLTADLAGDDGRTFEVTPAVVVPAPAANLSGTTVVRDPAAAAGPVVAAPVVVPDASVTGEAVVAPARIIESKPTTRTRRS